MSARILFVCLGNICRSPLAAAIIRELADEGGYELEVDSAGTGAWHVGEPADPRSTEVAARFGIDLDGHRARQVRPRDFEHYDLLIAMDRENVADLEARAPAKHRDKIRLLRDHDPEGDGDVPDPYWGGPQGFELVYFMLQRSCAGLLEAIASASSRDPSRPDRGEAGDRGP